jgi:transcriptional regulator with XRE-family HTH domain
MSFGERIREKRKENKLTQKQLAALLGGIDDSTISKWEKNVYEPDTATLNKLSRILSVSTDYLVSGQEKEPEEILDDPQLGLWFKEGKRSSAANRQKALDFLKYLEEQEKDRKSGDKQ